MQEIINGNLNIGGIDCLELVKQYNTPLYVMDEQIIIDNCKLYKKSIDDNYDGKGLVCYASKAFSCKEIYRIVNNQGLGIDVVSIGELYTALSVGFPAKKIIFHGNNKTVEELEDAIKNKVFRIVVDNLTELENIDMISQKLKCQVDIMLRLKPGIDAHTHEFIKTGQIDSKFGFAIENGEAFESVKIALSKELINLKGIHCHIGSQIFDIDPFKLAGEVMLDFVYKIKNETGVELEEINLGGGFGIKYTDEDFPVEYDKYMEQVAVVIKQKAKKLGLKQPFIYIEPGRSIVGMAGTTLYTIGNVKNIPNVRTYVSVDGGMTDNPRYALYQSKYDMLIANKANQDKTDVVTIAGKCCESGDLLGKDIKIQSPENGDILAVLSTGAYNYSMASNYNRLQRPAVVMVNDGNSRVIIKRESLEDLVCNDI